MVGVVKSSNGQRDTAKWLKYGTLAVSDSSIPSSKMMMTEENEISEENDDQLTTLPFSQSISVSLNSYCSTETASNGTAKTTKDNNVDCMHIAKLKSMGADETRTTPDDRVRAVMENFYLTDHDVRDALWNFVLRKRFYSRRPIFEMEIVRIQCTCLFRYILETCLEVPQTRWITEPYDSWEGPLTAATAHMDTVQRSATVKACQPCCGRGVKPCVHCMCTGRARCPFCQQHSFHHDGVGHLHSSRCLHCSGFSYLPCPYCTGNGHIMCSKCKGKGKLKSYLQSKMTTKTMVSDLIMPTVDDGSLQLEGFSLKYMDGIKVYEDENRDGLVTAINSISSLSSIEQVSLRLLTQHELAYPSSKVKVQKHKVIAIPMAKIEARYKKVSRTFYIYGQHRTVHFADYFAKCSPCCTMGCSLM